MSVLLTDTVFAMVTDPLWHSSPGTGSFFLGFLEMSPDMPYHLAAHLWYTLGVNQTHSHVSPYKLLLYFKVLFFFRANASSKSATL